MYFLSTSFPLLLAFPSLLLLSPFLLFLLFIPFFLFFFLFFFFFFFPFFLFLASGMHLPSLLLSLHSFSALLLYPPCPSLPSHLSLSLSRTRRHSPSLLPISISPLYPSPSTASSLRFPLVFLPFFTGTWTFEFPLPPPHSLPLPPVSRLFLCLSFFPRVKAPFRFWFIFLPILLIVT